MRTALLIVIAGCGRIWFDPLGDTPDGAIDAIDALVSTCTTDPDLAACYSFEGDALDSTANANHATAASVSFGEGRIGQAMYLDVASDVRVSDTPSLDADVAVTVEAWIRLAQVPAQNDRAVIVDHNFGYVLYLRPTEVGAGIHNAANMSVSHDVAFTTPLDSWHHVAMTHDGGTLAVWIDGTLVGSRTVSGPISTAQTDGVRIGGNLPDGVQTAPQRLIGAIDEVKVWRVARTAQQLCQSAGTCL